MDPNANLAEQEALYHTVKDTLSLTIEQRRTRNARLRELRAALNEWIAGGGFEPDWSKAPKAARWFGE
jgi:hypothetical protein